MSDFYKGNAEIDGQLMKHWIVGHFMPPDNIRHSDDVEIKWEVHSKGEKREDWVTHEQRTTISILISGRVTIEFRNESCELSSRGDYVMWGVGVDHRWEAIEDSVVITVRWPSHN